MLAGARTAVAAAVRRGGGGGGCRAALLSYSAENLGSIVVGSLANDFPDRYGLGRLNNGSFGGTPVPVKA